MTEIEQLWQMIDRCAAFPVPRESGRTQSGHAPFLAEDLRAPISLPSFDQSAMDGYAFADGQPGWHAITMTLAAGQYSCCTLAEGQAARVLTGAPVPQGTLAVARQEDCEVRDGRVRLRDGVKAVPGTHIRRRGEVITAGEVVLRRGQPVHPGTVAFLVALGVSEIPRLPRLTAVHLATGDELLPAGLPLRPGKVYDSNGPMMQALLEAHHVTCRCLRVADAVEALVEVVAVSSEDLLLISGGSGPGDRDHTRSCLEAQGFTIHASCINSRPGKPLIFATRGSQLAFGLPGNPLSQWVCFHAFVARAIARMQGQEPAVLLPVELEQPIDDAGDGRRTWTPARISWETGKLRATPMAWKHSGDLRCLVEANALLLDGQRGMLTST